MNIRRALMQKKAQLHQELVKQAIDVGKVLDTLKPTEDNLTNYGIYGGGGALAGGALGAIIQALRGKSILKGLLAGGVVGGGLGVGAKGLGDYVMSNTRKDIDYANRATPFGWSRDAPSTLGKSLGLSEFDSENVIRSRGILDELKDQLALSPYRASYAKRQAEYDADPKGYAERFEGQPGDWTPARKDIAAFLERRRPIDI